MEEHELLGPTTPARRPARRRCAPCLYARGRREAEQAADDRSHRVLAFADAEIQHEAAMDRKALRLREARASR